MPALVWIHFKMLNSVHAQCKYCEAVLNVANGSTKGLWTHVSRKHPQKHLSYDYNTEETEKEMKEIAKKPPGEGVSLVSVPIPHQRGRRKKNEDQNSVGAVLRTALLEQKRMEGRKLRTKLPSVKSEPQDQNEPSCSKRETKEMKKMTGKEYHENDGESKHENKRESSDNEEERGDEDREGSEDSGSLFKVRSTASAAIFTIPIPSGKYSLLTIKEEVIDENVEEEPVVEDCWKDILAKNGYNLTPDMDQSGNEPMPALSCQQMNDAFKSTITRDYERAVAVVRKVVASDHTFTADELELVDHVFACVLNTSHYDETMIEVCWEWIKALERPPRAVDPRSLSTTQLSIYFAYHTICRVQERMPRLSTYPEIRRKTWASIVNSFQFLWTTICANSKVWDDRLDIAVNWSYLALQYSDVCDDLTVLKLKRIKEDTVDSLSSSVLIEPTHQSMERVHTIERNIHDICLRKGTSLAKIEERCGDCDCSPQEKRARVDED